MGFMLISINTIGILWGSNISRFIQTIFKLVLIPNTPNLDMVSHLCPISLCNAFYKLLTKLLVNKLKPFLPYMIHPAQSGFMPGRRATDSYIIMQEILHCIHKQRGKTNLMAAKIVLESRQRLRQIGLVFY